MKVLVAEDDRTSRILLVMMLRKWGYDPQVRQLSTGGREVCCYATRAKRGVSPPHARRRPGR